MLYIQVTKYVGGAEQRGAKAKKRSLRESPLFKWWLLAAARCTRADGAIYCCRALLPGTER